MRILVLRGGALGDLILTLPVLREIKQGYREASVELWGVFPQAQLAVPDYVDQVGRLDLPEIARLFIAEPLPEPIRTRLERFHLAISFLSDPGGVIERNLALAGINRVIAGSSNVRPGVHAVYQLAKVLRRLGLTLRDPVPRLPVPSEVKSPSRLGFHLGSGSVGKNWPIDRWIEFVEQVKSLFDDFLLIGGETDSDLVREFCSRCSISRLRTLLNASLLELSRALSGCRLFVGHDTGVTHLAAAVGTATVALFGPTDPDVWAPLGDHVRVVRSRDGLMESVEVTAVVAAVGGGERWR